MPMNREAWIFGIQVVNQSVENGSIPLGGDLPRISLYSRNRRSRESWVSHSSTCKRAPRWMRSVARWTSRASATTLRLRILGRLLHRARGQDRRVHAGDSAVFAVTGQQVPDHLIFKPEATY